MDMTNFFNNYILTSTVFSPFIGILLIVFISVLGAYGRQENQIHNNNANALSENWALIIGLIFSALPSITTIALLLRSETSLISERFKWLEVLKIDYSLQADGLSLVFLLLTSFLTFVSIIVYWKTRKNYNGSAVLAIVLLLLLEVCCLGVFVSNDLILFYIFFEASLIPMLFIIGIWGREDKVYAAFKLFIYTIFGSLLFLLSIIYLKSAFATSEISELKILIPQLAPNVQKYLWFGILVAFAIKLPIFPFHTWLPDAHVQAPTFGSMMLAGIIIKLGGYGIIKILLPLFPEVSANFSQPMALISVVAIIYGSLVALGQKDIKKLVAYSSVAHMGYVTLGIFVPCGLGYSGAVFQMISHGFISSALFMCLGFIYERSHTYEIAKLHSLASKMSFLAIVFMILVLGSVGLPGTSGFIGEFLVIVASLSRDGYLIYGILTATGLVFGAIYMLLVYKKIFMEHRSELVVGANKIRTTRLENSLLIVFGVTVIYFGLQPMKIISKISEVNVSEYGNCSIQKVNLSSNDKLIRVGSQPSIKLDVEG